MSKRLLIVKGSSDICAAETDHIKTIAEMFGMAHCVTGFSTIEQFKKDLCAGGKYNYIYLAAHANAHGFGERDGSRVTAWSDLGSALCETLCLNPESVLLLGCCRGGLAQVADDLFSSCEQIDYVCGPRWTVSPAETTTGIHVFLYNMEVRREQPSTAVKRASKATGYDFFCYDRVEVEDACYRNHLERGV